MLSLVRTYHRTSGYLQFNLGVLLRVADRSMDLVPAGPLVGTIAEQFSQIVPRALTCSTPGKSAKLHNQVASNNAEMLSRWIKEVDKALVSPLFPPQIAADAPDS